MHLTATTDASKRATGTRAALTGRWALLARAGVGRLLALAAGLLATLALALAPAALAYTHGSVPIPGTSPDGCTEPTDFTDGVCVADDGLLVYLLPDGTTIVSHGPDPVPGGGVEGAEGEGSGGDGGATSPPPLPAGSRDPACAPTGAWRFQVLYVIPYQKANNIDTRRPQIRDGIKRANAFLNSEGVASGATSRTDFKVKCNSDNSINIQTVNSEVLASTPPTQVFGKIAEDLRNKGFTNVNTIYWVFWDARVDPYCGQAGVGRYWDDSLYRSPPLGPLFAMNYACIDRGSPGDDATAWMHEATHAMHAVNSATAASRSPNSTGAWHCNDDIDVMCYDDGGPFASPKSVCSSARFDCGRNDYFNVEPASTDYLYTHWNLGSCANRYLLRTGCITEPQSLTATGNVTSGQTASITLNWSAPADTGGAPIKQYEVFRADCPTCAYSLRGTTTSRTYTDPVPLPPGQEFYYKVRAENVWLDLSGFSNVANAHAQDDTTVPQTTITAGPSEGQIWTNRTVTFGFTSSEPGSTFECRMDSSGWSACSSPKSYSSLSLGSHTFQVRAIDPSGNIDPSPAARSFTYAGVL